MIVLDLASTNLALPRIARDLELTESQLSWVVTAYALSFACLLLLGARLGEALGPRCVFVLGMVLFGAAALVGGSTTNASWLVMGRAVQGAAAALVSPSALSCVSRLFPDGRERNRALAIWGASGSAGAPAGALLGGSLIEVLGWSAVLLVSVPLCATAAVLALRALPAFEPSLSRGTFDGAGAFTVTSGLAVLVYTAVSANRSGWGSAHTLAGIAAAGGLIAMFVAVERRTPSPLLPSGIFRSSNLGPASVVSAVGAMPVYGMAFGLSLYLQEILDHRPLATGLVFLPFGLFGMVSARAASRIATRFGFKPVTVLGLCVMAVGLAPLATLDVSTDSLVRPLVATALVGSGSGLVLVSTYIAGLSRASEGGAGMVAGVITTAQQIGAAIGVALTVAALDAVAQVSGEVAGLRAAFGVDLVLTISGVVLALVLMSSHASHDHAFAARAGRTPTATKT